MIDIIIPHSASDEYRNRNLFFVVKYYKKYLPDSNIIIVEQNTETDINSISDLVYLHLKLKISEKLFYKSFLLNEAYNVSESKYLIFNDNDCIANANILLQMADVLKLLDSNAVIPYNQPVINLTEYQTKKFIENHNTFNYNALDLIRRGWVSNGGIVMISSENYYKIGGHDPRFIGWGGEDDAFYLKALTTIGLVRLNDSVIHMYHPKGIEGGHENPHYSQNCHYWDEYKRTAEIPNIINKIGFNHLKK